MGVKLKLYNTLTREKAEFRPIDPNNVRMYVCGPTVYDYAHIGNARPVIVFDVLYRLLQHLYGADHVTYARNITDVDDKINARALRDHPGLPLNEAIRLVTEKTETQFHEDVKALGCLEPNVEPRATDNIPQMIDIIERLVAKGHAYVAGGEVLFDTKSMSDYGQLSKRPLDEQQAGARIAVDAHKKNPGDFVLWKLSSHNEPGWESPWGRGRPGWHIECSAMSGRYLGEVFDIHGGGLDLIFPHHENEIAQSRCAHGTEVMANVWMHNGFVQVEGRKMSKSEGNFVTIHDLLHTDKFGGRQWPGEVLRLAMLMTHYREPIDFSVKRLEEASAIVNRWADVAFGTDTSGYSGQLPDGNPLLDDLNTPLFVTQLQALYKDAKRGNAEAKRSFKLGLQLLGLEQIEFYAQSVANLIPDELSVAVDALVEMRLEMLKAKNFAEADKIRDDLSSKGIQLRDGKDPASGERVTTWEVRR
ncbi:cysteine--tRNA ligase [Pseudorhizobium flavum]|uniref:Cysteine--tRNA ligase n=1 Tax=Pseudorhizobium flavum TaxID=1335061 RepID=A0A7W9YVW7_9HYPH|nr:cysteine--tRNA ligase [Pseudorhizobium flavum]MBB6179009.1 cysteinyl-tRNA synthetase [Pseudorhizobium flavum]